MYRADLHIHSTISDSNYTVDNIIEKAKNIGLTHMAFTEHDTTENSEYAVKRGRENGMNIIPGIEISAYSKEINKKVHILGYNYKSNNNIEALCSPILERRNENCIKQIKILRCLGYEIDVDSVKKISGKYIYKQHILDYLCRTNQADWMFGRVYKEIFKNSGPCDFDIKYVDPVDAVKAIVNDGGFAVLAHPGQQENLGIIESLIDAGLSGIEINHHGNADSDKEKIKFICERYNLFMTGGSDYHGEYEPFESEVGSNLAHESSKIIFI